MQLMHLKTWRSIIVACMACGLVTPMISGKVPPPPKLPTSGEGVPPTPPKLPKIPPPSEKKGVPKKWTRVEVGGQDTTSEKPAAKEVAKIFMFLPSFTRCAITNIDPNTFSADDVNALANQQTSGSLGNWQVFVSPTKEELKRLKSLAKLPLLIGFYSDYSKPASGTLMVSNENDIKFTDGAPSNANSIINACTNLYKDITVEMSPKAAQQSIATLITGVKLKTGSPPKQRTPEELKESEEQAKSARAQATAKRAAAKSDALTLAGQLIDALRNYDNDPSDDNKKIITDLWPKYQTAMQTAGSLEFTNLKSPMPHAFPAGILTDRITRAIYLRDCFDVKDSTQKKLITKFDSAFPAPVEKEAPSEEAKQQESEQKVSFAKLRDIVEKRPPTSKMPTKKTPIPPKRTS